MEGVAAEAASLAGHLGLETWPDGAEVRLHVCARDAFGRALADVVRARDGASLADDLLIHKHGVPYRR
jgi:hypothetical protein